MKLISKDDIIYKVIQENKYTVYPDGRVISNATGKEYGYTDSHTGYRYLTTTWNGSRRKIKLHRLVWAIYGNIPLDDKLVINHKNGIRSDNRIENLELVTQSKNNKHRFQVLKHPAVIGYKKINKEIANSIRELRYKGWKYSELCKKFNLCKSTISYIINNKTWK